MSYPWPTVDLAEIWCKYHAAERAEKRANKQQLKDAKRSR
jgi:hypothetical protein